MTRSSSTSKDLYPTLRRCAAALVASIMIPVAGLLAYMLHAERKADETSRRLSLYHQRTESLAKEAQQHLTRLQRFVDGRAGRSVAGSDAGLAENEAEELRVTVERIVQIQRTFGAERYAAVVERIERGLENVLANFEAAGVGKNGGGAVTLDEYKSMALALLQLERLHGIRASDGIWLLQAGGKLTFRGLAPAVALVVAVCGLITWQILRLMGKMAQEVDDGTRLLRGSEERTQSILTAAPDAIITLDQTGRILAVNPAAGRMFGRADDAMIGCAISVLVSPASSDGPEEVIASLLGNAEKNGGPAGALVGRRSDGSAFPIDFSISRSGGFGFFTAIFRDATERKRHEEELERMVEKLEHALGEVKALKEQAEAENLYLREEIRTAQLHEDIIGQSDALKSVLLQAERVAKTGSTVLIQGETGTGKELVARAIHRMSPRSEGPLVVVNCAAMPEALVEAELFGRQKGAYTGAVTSQFGRFEAANGGTIFLDEVGELPLSIQAKLLRVLQEGQFERLGSSKTVKVDIRLLAATNRNLEEAVRRGIFRRDLYYRLNVFPIHIPPLRERPEDIAAIARHFVEEFSEKMGRRFESISRRSLDELREYSWPGNVRELRNLIERAVIIATGKTLRIDVPGEPGQSPFARRTMSEVEKEHIVAMLKRAGWKVRGRGGAAEFLGLPPSTLESRMKKLGIERPGKSSAPHPRTSASPDISCDLRDIG